MKDTVLNDYVHKLDWILQSKVFALIFSSDNKLELKINSAVLDKICIKGTNVPTS